MRFSWLLPCHVLQLNMASAALPSHSLSWSCVPQPECCDQSSYPLRKCQIVLGLLYTWWGSLSGTLWALRRTEFLAPKLCSRFSTVMEVGAPSSWPRELSCCKCLKCGCAPKRVKNMGKKYIYLKIWLSKYIKCMLLEAGRMYSQGGSPYSWPSLTFLFKLPSQPDVRERILGLFL